MDLVDIDKVLDDFELNEDNNENIKLNNDTSGGDSENFASKNVADLKTIQNNLEENNSTLLPEAYENPINSSSTSNFLGPQTSRTSIPKPDETCQTFVINENGKQLSHATKPLPPLPQSSSSSNSSSKVNVSNVFSSLNDYVNAGLDTNFQKMVICQDDSLPPTTLAPPPPTSTSTTPQIVQSKSVVDNSSPSSDSLKVVPQILNHHHKKHKPRAGVARTQNAATFYSNSSSPDSSRSSSASSSRRTTPTSSTTSTSDEEEHEGRQQYQKPDPIETRKLIPTRNKAAEVGLSIGGNIESGIDKIKDHEKQIADINVDNDVDDDDDDDDEDEQESMNVVSDLRTHSNQINNKTATIFSSSSSYCYNENNSTDVTFSNDIVSLNETSSLSSLMNISHNNEEDERSHTAIINAEEDVDMVKTDEETTTSAAVNTTKNEDENGDIETIDRSSVLLKDQNEVHVSCGGGDVDGKFDDFETRVIENVAPPVVVKPIGFESTMDDVSDTELESYLQELEFETNSSSAQPQSLPPIVDEGEASQPEISSDVSQSDDGQLPEEQRTMPEGYVKPDDELSSNLSVINVDVTPPSLSDVEAVDVEPSSVTKEEKNVDNISQASTVECNEVVLSHTDLDDKIISSDESPVVGDSLVTDDGEISGAEIAIEEEARSLQPQPAVVQSATVTENVVGDETKDDENTTSSQAKRPSTLNFPTAPPPDDIVVAPAGQTPPPHDTTGQLSSSSSDDMTNPSSLHSGANTSGAPALERGALEIVHEDSPLSGTPSRHHLGKIPPYWVPDSDALNCMQCDIKFTLMKRRHHCRACGKVLCSGCCSMKAKLEYLNGAEVRVCQQCDLVLNHSDHFGDPQSPSSSAGVPGSSSGVRSPNPNNPMEYCSRLPPHQQVASNPGGGTPISVMVPVGVLKREGAPKSARKEKNVIFSDGIRPGCDLTELDHNWDAKSSGSSNYGRKSGSKRVQTPPGESSTKSFRNSIKLPKVDETNNSYIPKEENGLPPIYVAASKTDFKFIDVTNGAQLITRLQTEELKFAIQRNFFVHVKILKLTCCINRTVINFTTQGLRYVGQDEIIILLELDDSNLIPKGIFVHLNEIYANVDKGQTITDLGYSIPRQPNFLGSKEHGGFLYIRQTFQCLQGVIVPESPCLIGILIHRWEIPWAKIFPLRLMLRLGALYRYYPSPHISERGRDSVYAEIAQTVINFLADFRDYSYTIPTIPGMTIHMEGRKICITIPRNRYDQVVKAIADSSEHILAMGGIFSKKAGGHLVCIQNTESGCSELYQYSTQAINIEGQPRKVTGTSFVILNGALKTTSGLSGKCTVVEDGLMVQILPQTMVAVREALKNIKDFNIVCGPIDATPDQTENVSIVWGDNDLEFNIGVISPIDSKPMDGIPSIRVHKGIEYSNANHIFRWTEVFIIKSDEDSPHGRDQVDISKISEKIARSTATALVTFLDLLAANGLTKLGLRVTLDPENVCYEAGSEQKKLTPLYMKPLDNELIPTLHRHASNLQTDTPIILELIFHILDK